MSEIADEKSTTKAAWLIFTAISLCWLIASAYMAPVMPYGDAIIFKGGGANWAAGLGFVNATTTENPTTEFKPYSSYPPFYSFLYGLWCKVFGLGEYQNTYFELTIGIVRNGLFLWIVLNSLSGFLTRNAALMLSVMIALVVAYHHRADRPESLCIACFQAGLLAYQLVAGFWLRYFGLGLCIGLIAITSPFCAIASVLIYAATVFENVRQQSWSDRMRMLLWLLVGFLPPVIPVLLYYIANPEAFELLVNHGTAVGGIGYLLKGGLQAVLDRYSFWLSRGYQDWSYFVGSILSFAAAIFVLGKLRTKRADYLRIALSVIALMVVLIGSNEYYGALVWFATVSGVYAVRGVSWSETKIPVWALLFSVTVLFLPSVIRQSYPRLHYREGYQAKVSTLRRILAEHNDVKYIVAYAGYYHLLRPFRPTFDYSSRIRQEDRNRILSSGEKVLLYEDTTSHSHRSPDFLHKLLWRPGDERFTKVYRVGEYLLVE